MLQWNSGRRSLLQTNRRQSGGKGALRWWVDPINRPASREALERRLADNSPDDMLHTSDGPFTAEHLQSKIVGTVVGVLVPRLHQPEEGDILAIEADGAATDEPEEDEPLTVDGLAPMPFEAIDFDHPLCTPQKWMAKFSDRALALHVADKTLRMPLLPRRYACLSPSRFRDPSPKSRRPRYQSRSSCRRSSSSPKLCRGMVPATSSRLSGSRSCLWWRGDDADHPTDAADACTDPDFGPGSPVLLAARPRPLALPSARVRAKTDGPDGTDTAGDALLRAAECWLACHEEIGALLGVPAPPAVEEMRAVLKERC